MRYTATLPLAITTLLLIAVHTCAAVSEVQSTNMPTYDVRIALSSKACIRCCSALLSTKRENLGVIGSRLRITVTSQHARILKQVRELVADTSLVRVEVARSSVASLDTIIIHADALPQRRTTFSLADESQRVLPFLDSLDAATTAIRIDTTRWDAEMPLRTRIVFDEQLRVHTHDDRRTVSIAGIDRALVVTPDTARVFPQYMAGMDSVDRAKLMMPTRTVVVSPTHVRYRFVRPQSPVDTVINGEMAKLYMRVESMISDVRLTPSVRNDIRQQTGDASIIGEWTTSDSTVVFVVDSSGPTDSLPTLFRFSTSPVVVPARFFPVFVTLCDAIGDTIYSCSPSDGWIRVTRDGSLLHMPPPTAVSREAFLARCVAFPGSVLISIYDPSLEDQHCSMLLSSNGVRISPPIWHSTRTIVAPVLRDNRVAIEAFHRSTTSLQRQVVWRSAP